MLKVDCTPGGVLATKIRQRISKEIPNMKILVQEQTGSKLRTKVSNSTDPWTPNRCSRSDCWICICSTKGSKGRCWWLNVGYKLTCKLCLNEKILTIYIGESKCGYGRMKEHADGLRLKQKDNVLYNHNLAVHPDREMMMTDWKVEITGRHAGPLQRQADEALRLNEEVRHHEHRGQREVDILNSRKEFQQPAGLTRWKKVKFYE